MLVFVVQPENQEGHAVVSIDRARQEKSWRRLQEIYEANEVIEAEVTNYNKGGLLVNLDGVRGFVPASQVTEIRGGDEASKQADMARLIGNSLPLKVIEINRHRNRLILSERQAVQERRDVMKERLIEELSEGEVRKGRVSSICDFGAFVDIGGADGLVHLSELSWSRVRHPSEVLRVGQEVDVYVLGINAQEKKIALSIKRTQAEPWSRVAAAYEVGQLVRGTVTQLANFGAFARIEDGIEGLIHVSELADDRVTHPKQVVSRRRRAAAADHPHRPAAAPHGPEPAPRARYAGCGAARRLRREVLAGAGCADRAHSSAGSRPKASSSATPFSATRPRRSAPSAGRAGGGCGDDAAQRWQRRRSGSGRWMQNRVPSRCRAGAAAGERSRRPQRRRRRGRRSSLPDELDGELSAMAMAFAMAGAPADLVAEAPARTTRTAVETARSVRVMQPRRASERVARLSTMSCRTQIERQADMACRLRILRGTRSGSAYVACMYRARETPLHGRLS